MNAAPPIIVYGDEDVSPRLVQLLATEGYYATCARDRGRLNLADHEHLVYATAHGLALLTFNQEDFRKIHRDYLAAGREHAGIIVSQELKGEAGLAEIAQRLLRLLRERSAEEIRNELIKLDDYAATQP